LSEVESQMLPGALVSKVFHCCFLWDHRKRPYSCPFCCGEADRDNYAGRSVPALRLMADQDANARAGAPQHTELVEKWLGPLADARGSEMGSGVCMGLRSRDGNGAVVPYPFSTSS
jgi:hypothetical protein